MATADPQDTSLAVAGSEVRLRWSPDVGETWVVASEPDWGRLEGIRLVSAAFEDGAVLGVAAIRPRNANGHGDDVLAARFVDAEGNQTDTSDALVSVEYDAARRPRRLGIELWPDSDLPPLRIAADREPTEELREEREMVPMALRLDGVGGRGTYETLRPG
ncbi:MAG: hypothetical protein ACJ75I_02540 [Solirubrobacterales bacterium]